MGKDESSEIPLAEIALFSYLAEHPGASSTELFDHYFPPSDLPFDRMDLVEALADALYYGTVTMNEERRLHPAESGSKVTP